MISAESISEKPIVHVKTHSTMSNIIGYCEKVIQSPSFEIITLIAEGKAVNKCVSISEILFGKFPELKRSITLDESPSEKCEPKLQIVFLK